MPRAGSIDRRNQVAMIDIRSAPLRVPQRSSRGCTQARVGDVLCSQFLTYRACISPAHIRLLSTRFGALVMSGGFDQLWEAQLQFQPDKTTHEIRKSKGLQCSLRETALVLRVKAQAEVRSLKAL